MKYKYIIAAVIIFLLPTVTPADDRDTTLQPEKVIKTIGVRQGMIIGEGGAGRGYFTFKLSPIIGNAGHIYANDIDRSALKAIDRQCEYQDICNITTVVGEIEDPRFPIDTLDMVILVYALHDFTKPVKWLENVKKYMRTDAKLIIVDRDPDRAGKGHNHFFSKQKMVNCALKANFKVEKIETFLPIDNIYIFSR